MAVDPKKLKAFIKRDGGAPFQKGEGNKVHAYDEDDDQDGGNPDDSDHEDVDQEQVDAIGQRVQSGNGDEHLMELVEGLGEDEVPEGVDEELWKKAEAKVKPKWDEYDQPEAVVAHVYEAMGGEIEDDGEDDDGDDEDDHGGGDGGEHDEDE